MQFRKSEVQNELAELGSFWGVWRTLCQLTETTLAHGPFYRLISLDLLTSSYQDPCDYRDPLRWSQDP